MKHLTDLPDTAAERKTLLLSVLKTKGLLELPEPITLSSGAQSRFFLDGKKALPLPVADIMNGTCATHSIP